MRYGKNLVFQKANEFYGDNSATMRGVAAKSIIMLLSAILSSLLCINLIGNYIIQQNSFFFNLLFRSVRLSFFRIYGTLTTKPPLCKGRWQNSFWRRDCEWTENTTRQLFIQQKLSERIWQKKSGICGMIFLGIIQ